MATFARAAELAVSIEPVLIDEVFLTGLESVEVDGGVVRITGYVERKCGACTERIVRFRAVVPVQHWPRMLRQMQAATVPGH